MATVALNAAKNAAILATTIIGAWDEKVGEKLIEYKKGLETEVLQKVENLKTSGWQNNFD